MLVAVGITRPRAMTMVAQQSKYGVPPQPPAPAPQRPVGAPPKDEEKR